MNESTGSFRGGGQNNYFAGIIRAFQCPVCIDYCVPPIYQCQAGHLICSLCLPRLSSCPTCRGSLSGSRNYAMEEVANYVPFPCTHSLRGCDRFLSLTEKKEHEVTCEWRPYNCPCPRAYCRWQGSLEEIMPHLLANHKTINMIEVQQQLEEFISKMRFGECVQLSRFIHQQLQKPATKWNYAICLYKKGEFNECVETLEELYQEEMKEEMKYEGWDFSTNLLKLNEGVSRELVGSHLLLAHCIMNNKQKMQEMLDKRKQFKIIPSGENLDIIIRLVHSHLVDYNYSYSLVKVYNNSFIDLDLDVETKKIDLSDCSLWLDSFDGLSPEELTLHGVHFFRDGQELEQVKLNDFIHFTNIKHLTLSYSYDIKNLSIDLSGGVPVDFLRLGNVEVLNWSSCNWSVKELHLENIPFVEKTPIKVQEMKIYESPLDVSCLPQTLQKLNLFLLVEVFVSEGVELPNLKHLTLFMVSAVGCLTHFHSAPLTHIHLEWIKGEVNVDLLPLTLTHLRISKGNDDIRVVGGVRKVDNLRLDEFSFVRVEECLSHLQTDYLLIDQWDGIEAKDLLQLMKKQIQTIAVGRIEWGAVYFNHYSSQLDREAEFYLLKRGKGRAMKEEDFNGLLEKFLPDEKFSY